jgi:hypothetical protein
MSDPIEDLENFDTEGMNVNPLPASEVRRRGNRMRRRNNTLATIGGIAAVAVIAVPLAMSTTGGDRTGPGIVNSPTPSPTQVTGAATVWLQEVPPDFPLTEGLPAVNESDGTPVTRTDEAVVDDITVCGVPAWSGRSANPVAAVDVAGAAYTGASEDLLARTLTVYENGHTAEQAFAALRVAVEDCPLDTTGGSTDSRADQAYVVSAADLGGDESFVFTQASQDDAGDLMGDLWTYQVVRVGNALYVAAYYGQGGANQQVVDHTFDLMAGDSAPVISDLCLFATEPCGPGDGEPAQGEGSGSPAADFAAPGEVDLTVGYPDTNGDDGSPVTTTAEPGITALTFCGATAWDPAGAAERAGATYTGEAEDFRGRTLAVYDDAAGARSALATLRSTVEDCPVMSEGGSDQVFEPVTLEAGDESFAFTQRYRTGGRFDTGLTVYQAVRVGNALYVAFAYGEGGGSPETIASGVERLGTDSQGVVDQLCVFTGGGC